MRLTAVGCRGSVPGPDSPASSYLVEAEDADGRTWRLLLDLGSGALGSLQRVVDPFALDAVLVTHLHPDHFIDLCPLYVYLRYHPRDGFAVTGGKRPVVVRGPGDLEERLGSAYGLAADETMRCVFDIQTHTPTWSLGPFTVEVVPVDHPVEAYGLRVHGPSEHDPDRQVVLAYSGDTDECPGAVDVARDADLFLCEAAFVEGRDEPRGVHLTGLRAGRVAQEAGAKQLVLTHLPPWNEDAVALAEARTAYTGPITVCEPLGVYRV